MNAPHQNSGQHHAAPPAKTRRVTVEVERHLRPPQSKRHQTGQANWVLVLWSFVAFSFAAFFLCGVLFWIKCHRG